MNYKVIITSVLLLLITPAINAQSSFKKCPDVSVIQGAASNFTVKKYDENYNVWYAYQNNKFDTKDTWTFMIAEVHAKNEYEARKKFMVSLVGLRFVKGANGENGSVLCYYNAVDGLKATAETPPIIKIDMHQFL